MIEEDMRKEKIVEFGNWRLTLLYSKLEPAIGASFKLKSGEIPKLEDFEQLCEQIKNIDKWSSYKQLLQELNQNIK